jgi:hypothetical protein|tara:strand:+ start:28 stop:207 length:180 start_codon:yes stop_codon:yes gene_type:complete
MNLISNFFSTLGTPIAYHTEKRGWGQPNEIISHKIYPTWAGGWVAAATQKINGVGVSKI